MMPYKGYVEEVFRQIQADLPRNYSPRDRSHKPTVRFLKKHKIRGMWLSRESTKKAMALFMNGPLREMTEAMLLTSMGSEEIAQSISFLGAVHVSDKAIREYKHYFWNTDLLSYEDWAYYLSTPSIKAAQLTALKSPRNPDGVTLTLYKMGIMPQNMDKLSILKSIRDISYMNFLEANGFPQGMKKSTMLLNYGTLVKSSQDKLDEYEAGEQDVINEFYKHVEIASRGGKHKSILELEGEKSEQVKRLSSGDPDSGRDGGLSS